MCCDWRQLCSADQILDALLDSDQVMIGRINALRSRTADYNEKTELAIDNADPSEFKKLVSNFKAHRDSP